MDGRRWRIFLPGQIILDAELDRSNQCPIKCERGRERRHQCRDNFFSVVAAGIAELYRIL
jgi:hypothetical protein